MIFGSFDLILRPVTPKGCFFYARSQPLPSACLGGLCRAQGADHFEAHPSAALAAAKARRAALGLVLTLQDEDQRYTALKGTEPNVLNADIQTPSRLDWLLLRLCCASAVADSLRESSLVVRLHEQTEA